MIQGVKKGAALAINQAAVANDPQTFEKMGHIGPKVCLTTANEPGFLGFHAFLQTGTHPLGGRFGAAQVVTADSLEAVIESPHNLRLNPLNLWQYTLWEDAESHERMHYEQYDRIFELCAGCLDMVVDGPWEPVYTIAEANMPPIIGMTDVPRVMGQAFARQQEPPKVRLAMRRLVALGEHHVREGHEQAFLEGAVKTLELLQEHAPGMIGWMILEKQGEAALSTFQLEPPAFWESLQTLGANPPKSRRTNFGEFGKDYTSPPIPIGGPKEYQVHMEWESPDALTFGLALTGVNPKLRRIHDEGVLAHLAKLPPYYRVFAPAMEDMIFFH
ncbi:sulfur oxygenase reductase [Thioalkalivibrio nitratireducens DSM 14787]|uniref:Sulfur oxygenase reductase n=1 Tax=Thioalkalivibrio nitratireducens (strain DSM 14787 / UNIQEM 213 / ALEN2) TaxID=1255043 RepID=L0DXR4_THIND|nr:sulfur oxygenase reductase family protein [Thioalkalivibrio nitratireducens]AGA34359.1 sulfur oxygenase reductase [Thioalkalivibrio nitratireducens DSM 14787]